MAETRLNRPRARSRGGAIVYCENAFQSLDGKTAHGLVRRSRRYDVLAVIDSTCAGSDAGALLDGRVRSIPIVADLSTALAASGNGGRSATHLVVGLAPVGGALDDGARVTVEGAIRSGLHVHSGLHDFIGDDPVLTALARKHGVELVDARRPPERASLHRFTGKIADVDSLKVAILGTDSGIGKRTTAWLLLDALRRSGRTAELIGTGQTSWLQGAEFTVVLDSLVYDFVPGEIEHAVWTAWRERRPELLVIEGQGGLLSPGYFGGQELLAAAHPEAVILQHAPGRTEYDGCPGFPIEPLGRQIETLGALSHAPLFAIAVSRHELTPAEMPDICASIAAETGLPAVDVLAEGAERLIEALEPILAARPCPRTRSDPGS